MADNTEDFEAAKGLFAFIFGALFFVIFVASIPPLLIPAIASSILAGITRRRAFKIAIKLNWLVSPLKKLNYISIFLILTIIGITSLDAFSRFGFDFGKIFSLKSGYLGHILPVLTPLLPIALISLYLFFLFLLIDGVEFQQTAAGYNAEKQTLKHLRQNFTKDNGWIVLDSHLFVFNQNQDNEWSAEVDHIVIGGSAIYLVETKYKSGTIHANADAAQWKVEHFDRQSSMRNALKQSQNSAKVLKRELKIPGAEFIPVVSIVGNDVQVVGGPSNVVACEDVATVIVAIERSLPNKGMNQAQALEIIERHSLKDSAAMDRHIARAQAKRAENERKNIFENAAV